MTNNSLLSIALAGVVAVMAIGIGIIATRESAHVEPDPTLYVDRQEFDELEERHRKLTDYARKAKASGSRLSERNKALEEQVSRLTSEMQRQRALEAAREKETREADASTLPVAFGKWADLDEIRNADWAGMGDAVAVMNELVLELYEAIENGETPDAELQEKIRAENNKLVRYYAEIMGKLPTHSPVNGEFSHPITLANLMGAMLERGEMPLSDEQRALVAQLGERYEAAYSELDASYTEDTPRLEKLVDELELKRDTMRSMESVLTNEQREVVIQPAIHNRVQLDALSPATMATMLAQPKNVNSLEELRSRLPGYLSEWFGVPEDYREELGRIAGTWIDNMKPLLEPVDEVEKFLELDRTIVAGRAQVAAMKQLLSLPDLDEKARKSILNHLAWRVPQVVKKRPE